MFNSGYSKNFVDPFSPDPEYNIYGSVKAILYATQLKYDHSNEFERGRSTSYYESFVDGDRKCTHLVKIEYVQTAPWTEIYHYKVADISSGDRSL